MPCESEVQVDFWKCLCMFINHERTPGDFQRLGISNYLFLTYCYTAAVRIQLTSELPKCQAGPSVSRADIS